MVIAGTALVVLFAVLSFQNSTVVTAVAIRVKDGATERRDRIPPGFGKEHALPD